MKKTKHLDEDELRDIVNKISKKCVKFVSKTVDEEIIKLKDYKNLDIAQLLAIVLISMSTIDLNLYDWLKKIYMERTNDFLSVSTLIQTHFKNIILNSGIEITEKIFERLH